jgi:hypothetical protein
MRVNGDDQRRSKPIFGDGELTRRQLFGNSERFKVGPAGPRLLFQEIL